MKRTARREKLVIRQNLLVEIERQIDLNKSLANWQRAYFHVAVTNSNRRIANRQSRVVARSNASR